MAVKGISLHIGLNKVDPNHYDGWDGELFACINDADFYEKIASDNGFLPTRLHNEQATSTAVLKELYKAAQQLDQGDIFLITYSGHGGSLPDLNMDEGDEYRKDETWCLYDRQLVDDELHASFSFFRAGVRILMFSDSCHSGTMAKLLPGEEKLEKDLVALYKAHKLIPKNISRAKIRSTYEKNIEIYKPILEMPAVDKQEVAAFVMLFAACQDHETAKEWGEHGVFTDAIEKLYSNDFESYHQLFDALKKKIPSRIQVPNLFKFGNNSFDFSTEKPFQLDQQAIIPKSVLPEPGKKLNKPVDEETTIILHSAGNGKKTKSREWTGQKEKEGGAGKDERFYELKNEKRSVGEAWDQAYQEYLSRKEGEQIIFAEPDIKSKYGRPLKWLTRGDENNYLPTWPQPENTDTEFIWHLDEQHSQLKRASDFIMGEKMLDDPSLTIRIGHIDTGYLDHLSKPAKLMEDLGVSFVKNEFGKNKGKDELDTGFPAEQDGHGCATMAILAGNKITRPEDSYTGYTGYFGAIPFAEVIPIRICDTVFNLFNANDVADGIDYAVDYGCEVITMSMAGYPTRRVADAVNRAYNKGVIVVTAAGNNWFKGIRQLTPKAVMYPARFARVVAATGACYNHLPYDFAANKWYMNKSEGGETMQGNWGPDAVMKTAVAAYTPNLPWATTRAKDKFYRSGGGTSSATPQIAAAFALWIVHNRKMLKEHGIENSWQKVEAARKAIFRTASKSFPEYKKYYGNGIIRAFDALNNFDFATEINSLRESPEAHVRFGGLFQFIGQWIKGKAGLGEDSATYLNDGLREMMGLEIMQLVYRGLEEGGDEELMKYASVLEFEKEDGAEFLEDPVAQEGFVKAIKRSSHASLFLKKTLPPLKTHN